MPKKSNLKKKKNLKDKQTFSETKSSIDVTLELTGRILQKFTRSKTVPAVWVNALTLAVVIMLMVYLIALATGGISRFGYRTIIFGGALIFLNFMLAKKAFDRTFFTLRHKLVDGLASSTDVSGIRNWLKAAKNINTPAIISVLVYAVYTAFIFWNPADAPAPIETAMMGGIMLIWTGFILYYMFLYAIFPLKLKECTLKLHKENPASTQLLVDWNIMMNFAAYMFAIMLAMGTLFTLALAPLSLRTLIFIVPRWLLLIVLFAVNQIILSGMITRSKRETLNEVEEKMAAMRLEKKSLENEKLQAVMRLWDYHDRVKGTRNTLLNFKGIVNFISTLLIPFLAFMLANLDAIIKLFGWGK